MFTLGLVLDRSFETDVNRRAAGSPGFRHGSTVGSGPRGNTECGTARTGFRRHPQALPDGPPRRGPRITTDKQAASAGRPGRAAFAQRAPCGALGIRAGGGSRYPQRKTGRPPGRSQPFWAAATSGRRTSAAKSSPLLLDAFAHHVQRETLHGGVGGLEHLLDGLLVVLHERLVEQRDFLQVLLHRAFDHLGDDRRPACLRLRQPSAASATAARSLAIRSAGTSADDSDDRLHGGHVHGHVLGGGFVALELDHHADARAVQVDTSLPPLA